MDARVPPFASSLAAALLSLTLPACGTRTGLLDARADAADAPDVADAVDAQDARDAQEAADAPEGADGGLVCPTQRPLWAEACPDSAEQASCLYVDGACKSECVCERGSFVCSADTCTSSCPSEPPANQPCAVTEINRVCDYGSPCVNICRCDPDGAGGGRWYCKYDC